MPERISAIPACPQPFPASQGSSDLTASQLIPRNGLSPLSQHAPSHGEFGLWFPLHLLEQHKAEEFGSHPLQIYPRSVTQSSTLMSEETCMCPKTWMAFPGCAGTSWSCTHVRLNGKGQSSVWLLAHLSVGKHLGAALPGMASTACSSWKGLLCVPWEFGTLATSFSPIPAAQGSDKLQPVLLEEPETFSALQLPLVLSLHPLPKEAPLQLSWSPFRH